MMSTPPLAQRVAAALAASPARSRLESATKRQWGPSEPTREFGRRLAALSFCALNPVVALREFTTHASRSAAMQGMAFKKRSSFRLANKAQPALLVKMKGLANLVYEHSTSGTARVASRQVRDDDDPGECARAGLPPLPCAASSAVPLHSTHQSMQSRACCTAQ